MNRKVILTIIVITILLTSCNKREEIALTNKDDTAIDYKIESPQIHNEIDYEIRDMLYEHKGININYPKITNRSDSGKEEKINELIEKEVFRNLNYWKDIDDITIESEYKVMFESYNILSLQFYGYEYSKSAPYPNKFLYTLNINLNETSKIILNDYINIDANFVAKLLNYQVTDPEINQAKTAAVEYIQDIYREEDLIIHLNGADSSYNNTPFIFSYLTEDSLGISIEVPNVVGGHVEMELKYEEIKESIKFDSEVWRGLNKF